MSVVRPQDLVVADYDLDGHLDIIVPTWGTGFINLIRVFYGFGDGNFAAPQDFNGLRRHTDGELGDFDNNGIPDAVVAASRSNRVQLMLSNGDRTWTIRDFASGSLSSVIGRHALAAVDFDLDGNLDVVVANANDQLNLLTGDGNGFLANAGTIALAFEPNTIRAGDIDRDGLEDLVAGSRFTIDFGILFHNRVDGYKPFEPMFQTNPSPFGPTDNKHGVEIVDITGDGQVDILVTAGDALHAILADPTAPGRFASPLGDFSTFTKQADGTFTRRLTDGTVMTFDATGLLVARTDRNGNTTAYVYDGSGRLLTETDPVGIATSYTYLDGLLRTIANGDGRVSRFFYDADGNLVRVERPDDSEQGFEYDRDHRMTTETSPRGFATSFDYTSAGRLAEIGQADGSTIALDIYRELGLADFADNFGTEANPWPYLRPDDLMTTITDGNGNPLKLTFNEFGGVIRITDVLGRTTTIERDADGRPTRITRSSDGELPDTTVPGFVVTELAYDASGNVTARREAVGTVLERETLFEYEPIFNLLTRITDPASFETNFEYDASGNLTKATDALGGEQISTYNAQGLRLTARDQNLNLTSFSYDALGNSQTITDALSTVRRLTRDAAGRVTTLTKADGLPEERSTNFTYDAVGRQLVFGTGAAVWAAFELSCKGCFFAAKHLLW